MKLERTTAIALAGIAAWLVFVLITWVGDAPLGHDESQYAIATRDVLAGKGLRWFYVSRGMVAVTAPGIWFGGSALALRVVPLLAGLGFVLATFVLARRVVGTASAAWVTVVLAGAATIARLGTGLLSDLPAAACLVAAVAVIVDEIDRVDGARWRLVGIAPLFAAAFYVRYGSVIPIAVIVVVSIAVGARTLVRRPVPVIVTTVVFVALLVPHFLEARALVGSSLGILLESREVPTGHHATDGLVTYLTSNPFVFYGLLVPFVLVAGIAAVRLRDRRRLLVWCIAIGSFLAMGLTTHGMLRYVVFSVALLSVLGTDRLRQWLAMLAPRVRRVAAGGVVIALVATWLWATAQQVHADETRRYQMRGILAAARAIRTDAGGAPCIVIGYHSTQLEWYSGCRAPLILDASAAAEAHARHERVYLVRDHTPIWAPKWQPAFGDYPGHVRLLDAEAVVEIASLEPR